MALKFNDATCSGCKACQLACTLFNFKEINPSRARLTVSGRFPSPGKYHVDVCNQCGECAKVCPTEAIQLNGSTYLIDKDKCISCMACVEACPSNVMMVDPQDNKVDKCNDCKQCVEICPRNALTFE